MVAGTGEEERGGGIALVCGTGAEIRGDKGGAEAAAAAALGRRVGSTCFARQRASCQHRIGFFPTQVVWWQGGACQSFYPYSVPLAIGHIESQS